MANIYAPEDADYTYYRIGVKAGDAQVLYLNRVSPTNLKSTLADQRAYYGREIVSIQKIHVVTKVEVTEVPLSDFIPEEPESEFPESVSDYEVWVKPDNNGGAWCVRNSMSHASAIREMEELQIEANENYARESLGPNKPKKREFFIVKVSESRERA